MTTISLPVEESGDSQDGPLPRPLPLRGPDLDRASATRPGTTISAPVETAGLPQAAPKPGRAWRLLWTASTISVLGDGAFVAALPLAAAGMTRDPHLIAGLTVAGTLPWLLFSLYSGAIADRTEGRSLLIRSQAAQLLITVLVGLAASFTVGGIWSFYILAFLLGMAAAMAKPASQTLIPSVVPRDHLVAANAQLFTAQSISQSFLGPAVGAGLFAAAPFLPFWVDAATFAVSIALLARLPRVATKSRRPRRNLHVEVKEGIAFLWSHRVLRTTTVLVATANFGNLMGYSTLVLYIGSHAYGVVLSASALGSILAGLVSKRIHQRFGGYLVVRVTVLTTPLMMIAIGTLGPNPVVVGVLMSISSGCAVLWNVASVSQRQKLTPPELQGRSSAAGTMLTWGTQPLGALAGGLLAGAFGLAAPWIVGGVFRVLIAVLCLPRLREWVD